MTSQWSVVSHSQRQTKNWGRNLALLLKAGDIVGLTGELGSGKTCFVRGVAEGLGVSAKAWIRSPTFTLINEYEGRLPLYHIDLYRVGAPGAQEGLDLREYLYGDGVSLVEWFEHLEAEDRDEHLEVGFAHAGVRRRRISFAARGRRYERIVDALSEKRFESAKIFRPLSPPLEP